MKDPDAAPAIELADLILAGGEPIHDFVIQLGTPYDEPPPTRPREWSDKVMKRGIEAGASLELILWLVLRDFKDREVSRDAAKITKAMSHSYPLLKDVWEENHKRGKYAQ